MTTSTQNTNFTDEYTKVEKHFLSEIEKIKDGYFVIELEEDGCDELGIKRWATCRNRETMREWNIESAMNYSIMKYKKKVMEEGIMMEGNIYYINPSSDIYTNNITFISKIEYNSNIETFNKIKSIMEKYIQYIEDKYKSTRSDRFSFSKYSKHLRIINNLNIVILVNFDTVLYSAKYIMDKYQYSKFIDNIKYKIKWTEAELSYIPFEF
jgi:hypothetical protein